MTTNGSLDERYLTWLHRQIEPESLANPARSHRLLIAQLYQTPFVWYIPNDDNRALDGLDVRYEFIDTEEGGDVPGIWLSEECSMLEMLIALSRRLEFDAGESPDYWFWEMVNNLNLRQYTDDIYNDEISIDVDEVLQILNDRTYHADGKGGLFPLFHPGTDQRHVEIWSQMGHYLFERVNV